MDDHSVVNPLAGVLLRGMTTDLEEYTIVRQLTIDQVQEEVSSSQAPGANGIILTLKLFNQSPANQWVWRHGEYFVVRAIEGGRVEAVLLTKSRSPKCRGEGCDGKHDYPHQWHLLRMPANQLTPIRDNTGSAPVYPAYGF